MHAAEVSTIPTITSVSRTSISSRPCLTRTSERNVSATKLRSSSFILCSLLASSSSSLESLNNIPSTVGPLLQSTHCIPRAWLSSIRVMSRSSRFESAQCEQQSNTLKFIIVPSLRQTNPFIRKSKSSVDDEHQPFIVEIRTEQFIALIDSSHTDVETVCIASSLYPDCFSAV